MVKEKINYKKLNKGGLHLCCYLVKCAVCGERYTECWELEPFHDTKNPRKRFQEPEYRECCGGMRTNQKNGKEHGLKPETDEVISYESVFLVGVVEE